MELTSIEIENYKSIKTPVAISFFEGLPTVLIGKNGSGKTNVLEALSTIALANTNYYGDREKGQIAYRAHIQLTEEDVTAMLPEVVYDKDKCEVIAYSSGNDLKIDRLRSEYDGSDREELLKSSKNELILSRQAVEDFEVFLNGKIPPFDREMYDGISVQADEKGHISIFLKEKTGEQINLNETSAGRRWYFTYYFMKNILSEGDIFIIDEPAAMLHPSAQREVLRELIELTKCGIKVVYSTHSPYLIPDERKCVHFVTMTEEGTKVSGVSSNQELINQMADIIGEDIFDIQTVFDMYAQGDTTEIGRKCYNAIKNKGEKLEDVAAKLLVSVETIKSWNRNGNHFRCPKLENIIAVSKYTNTKIQDLLN